LSEWSSLHREHLKSKSAHGFSLSDRGLRSSTKHDTPSAERQNNLQ